MLKRDGKTKAEAKHRNLHEKLSDRFYFNSTRNHITNGNTQEEYLWKRK